MIKNKFKNNKGSIFIITLIISEIFIFMALAVINFYISEQKYIKNKIANEQALFVAEAGVNYYRWVLYHNHNDYCNKESCKSAPDYGPYGPYSYSDASGNTVGYYELYITPPPLDGSTLINIKSVGWMKDYPSLKRTIEVKCGIPSWSSYSTLSNDEMRFGEGTEVWGPTHSNGGVRFDGLTHNLISSSLLSYNDPDHSGDYEFGVHTHKNIPPQSGINESFRSLEAPPNTVTSRNDVFMAGRTFPTPIISFNLLDNYISEIYLKASANGLVLPENSGKPGYHIILNPNNIINIKSVNSVTSTCNGEPTDGITNETNFLSTTTPANGIIYVKDKVWVDGTINNMRITIAAFEDPPTGNTTDITINNDLKYTNFDGRDSIGLIAQRNINVGLYSLNNLTINAALIAKEGRIGRFHFLNSNSGGCSRTYYERNSITVYGSLATRNRYGFKYTDGAGYQIRNLKYDNNLTYSPPPHFPTTGEYTFISWEEK